ncbi:hypothetical protein F4806DRAFT_503754 [Annulohypoxylon nitens]|nr:hypothetical protein F4806DRAFT_503754 [Annulohypoxylon nitens]
MADTSASAYLSYKDDTRVFLSWLGQSSERYGWKSRQARKEAVPTVQIAVKSSGRLKGKERKKAKEEAELKAKELLEEAQKAASKTILSVAEVIEQIELVDQAITRKKEEPMPFTVWKALQRSIKARERFSRSYKSSKSCSDDKLESHDHFIDVMKKAICLAHGKYDKGHQKKLSVNDMNQEYTLQDINLFECLEVDDLSEFDVPDIPDNEDNLPITSDEDKLLSDLRPLISKTDLAFFFVFKDLHSLRAQMQRVFRRLVAGDMCLLNATLSIAVAFDIIRKAEDEALKVADTAACVYPEYRKPLTDLGAYAVYSRMFQQQDGIKALVQETGSSDEFDDFILHPLQLTLIELRHQQPTTIAPEHFYFLRPFTPLSKHYADAPEKLNNPRIQKCLKEDQILKHFYYEMRMMEGFAVGKMRSAEANSGFNRLALPFYDIFHNALRPIWQKNRISFESAFAARVMLDMCEICGTSLQNALAPPKEATTYVKKYGFPTYDSVSPIGLEFPGDIEGNFSVLEMRSRYDLTGKASWIKFRPKLFEWYKLENQKLAKELKEGEEKSCLIWPHDSDTFMLDNNVLYGGTVILDLITMSEMVETRLADYHLSIFCVAHIYNAARQLAGLDVSWPEMDQFIELQKDSIFANDIPTTPKAVSTRFTYRMGLKASSKIHKTILGPGPQPWSLQPTATSLIIREYFAHEINLPRMVHKLEEQAIQYEKAHKRPSRASDGPSSTPDTEEKNQREAAIEKTLQRIEKYIDAMLPAMQFDYINLTRTCNRIMESLRHELITEHEVEYHYSYKEGTPRCVVHTEVTLSMVLDNFTQLLTHNLVKRHMKRLGKENDDNAQVDVVGSELKHAAGFLKKFITNELSRGSVAEEESA